MAPPAPQTAGTPPSGTATAAPAPAASEPPAPAAKVNRGAKSAQSWANFHINALDILQYGLAPALEFGGRHYGIFVRPRFPNAGMVPYLLSEDFVWGIGAGAGVRFFFLNDHLGNMRGLWAGFGVEYAYTMEEDEDDDRARYKTHSLVPGALFGYRWVFGSFLLGVGGQAGPSIPVAYSDEPVGPDGCFYADSCPENRDVGFAGGLVVEIGVFFGGKKES